MNDWRKAVGGGARWLYFAPLVALALAPIAVFFRTALVVLALWHSYWVWRFTAVDPQSATLRLGRGRWALRMLALAGLVLITLDYEVYRALLIATFAAYLAYLSELLPALGLSSPKTLRLAALGALLCCALVAGELVLRRSMSSAGWSATPGNCLSALAVPFGLLAWFQVARVREPDLEADAKSEPAAHVSSIRAWARKVREVVIPFGIAFSLGVGVVLVSLIGGAAIAFVYADLDPGVIRAGASFCLLCADGWLLLVLRKFKRQTLRRAVLAVGLTHVPLWWVLVFPTQFQSSEWKRSRVGSETRSDMAEDLIYSRVLLGKTHSEVVELIGPSRGYGTPPGTEHYSLGDRPCRGFEIKFDGKTVTQAYLWMCD